MIKPHIIEMRQGFLLGPDKPVCGRCGHSRADHWTTRQPPKCYAKTDTRPIGAGCIDLTPCDCTGFEDVA